MKFHHRVALGAIGGITPYLITLLSIDFKNVVTSYIALDWLGLMVRCIVLIFLGSLVAYLHKSEKDPFKIYQLGLAAPALLATFINGGIGTNETLPYTTQSTDYSISIFSQAIAQDKIYKNQNMLRAVKVTGWSRFSRGLLGTKLQISKKEIYFVVVGLHKTFELAKAQADGLRVKDYKAQVYNPHGSSNDYTVVIAANVTKTEAAQIKDKAMADGLPSDSYIWSY